MATILTEEMRHLAKRHRVRWSRDDDGEFIIRGRRGDSHIYDHYRPGHLGLCIVESKAQVKGTAKPLSSHWKRQAMAQTGWVCTQEGDVEGCFVFPITDENMKTAIRIAKIRRKRRVPDAERERLAEIGAKHRFRKDMSTAVAAMK